MTIVTTGALVISSITPASRDIPGMARIIVRETEQAEIITAIEQQCEGQTYVDTQDRYKSTLKHSGFAFFIDPDSIQALSLRKGTRLSLEGVYGGTTLGGRDDAPLVEVHEVVLNLEAAVEATDKVFAGATVAAKAKAKAEATA